MGQAQEILEEKISASLEVWPLTNDSTGQMTGEG